jgi:hypothetical protein
MIVVPENDPQGERHTMAAELACQVTGSSPAQACLLLLAAGRRSVVENSSIDGQCMGPVCKCLPAAQVNLIQACMCPWLHSSAGPQWSAVVCSLLGALGGISALHVLTVWCRAAMLVCGICHPQSIGC